MSHRQVINILFFNHNVFFINYKSVIFLCFIYQKQFCLPLGIPSLAITFQFRCFFDKAQFFLPFGIHNLVIDLTLLANSLIKGAFLFFLVCVTIPLSIWLSSEDSLIRKFISSFKDDSCLLSSLFPLRSNEQRFAKNPKN